MVTKLETEKWRTAAGAPVEPDEMKTRRTASVVSSGCHDAVINFDSLAYLISLLDGLLDLVIASAFGLEKRLEAVLLLPRLRQLSAESLLGLDQEADVRHVAVDLEGRRSKRERFTILTMRRSFDSMLCRSES